MDADRQQIERPAGTEGLGFALIAGLIVLTALAVVWAIGGQFLERWSELSGLL